MKKSAYKLQIPEANFEVIYKSQSVMIYYLSLTCSEIVPDIAAQTHCLSPLSKSERRARQAK